MPWLQIILNTDAATVEQISDGLLAVGAVSVSLSDAENQPLYEPPLNTTPIWKHTQITGLFAGDTDSTQLQGLLQAVLAPLPLPPGKVPILED